MRIISGKYKGQNLVSFRADHIRPTTDRVKESMFNIIQASIPEARVLDLFSGTGSLGIEALSRGASSVLFVEKNKRSIAILEKNLAKLKVSEPFQILNRDVLSFLTDYSGEPFEVVFADPPFTEQMAHDVILAADQSRALGDSTIFLIESGRREKVLDDYPALTRYDVREFGDKYLSFFRRKG
ncbi:MAG: 16S rRNA (guanine(966)-N(2))-methyltransferase RsmD [Proteobacteria bacterium]|jgi:16S rRNA (guanine966-N2)-methyltransferase|nr:16S rRNA (guanine(966)-N(2))-methyltransferase RsmD [Pseudomonadota bacterium]